MKMVVGLGNPGRTYQNTRHNIGFMVIDFLADKFKIDVNKEKWNTVYGKGWIENQEVLVVKPVTYMNRSGEAVSPMMHWYKMTPDDLIVVYDDVDLPLGRIRIRPKGSAGGHKGLDSVIEHIGTQEFIRIRLGVGRPSPENDTADHVLSKFDKSEKVIVEETIENANDAIVTILNYGLTSAMNRYNKKLNQDTGDTKE